MAMPKGGKKIGAAPGLLKMKGAKPPKAAPPKPQPSVIAGPAFKKGGAVKGKCCK